MNLIRLKEQLYDITAAFFNGAAVIWTELSNTRPKLPYVTMKTGNVQRHAHPVMGEDGSIYYHCSTVFEVNLYTKGKPEVIQGAVGNYSNTAVEDLMVYANYMESEAVVDSASQFGISITLTPPVRDVTELLNDGSYRYRAMAEFTVSYTMTAEGMYGMSELEQIPGASGAGSKEQAEMAVEYIESVVIENEVKY